MLNFDASGAETESKPAAPDALSLDSVPTSPTSDPEVPSDNAASLNDLLEPNVRVVGGGTGGQGAEPNILHMEDLASADTRQNGAVPPPRQPPPMTSMNFTFGGF